MRKSEYVEILAVLTVCTGIFVQRENYAMELGGFDVEVNTSEQWELPEDWEEPSISEEIAPQNPETYVQPESVEADEEIWGDGEDLWQYPREETSTPVLESPSAPVLNDSSIQEALPVTEPAVVIEPTLIQEPTLTPEPTMIMESTPTPVPTLIVEPIPTQEPMLSVTLIPDKEVTPVPELTKNPSLESSKALPAVTDIQIKDDHTEIRVRAETGLKLLSVRINGLERKWEWSGSVLTVEFCESEKENKNCAELLIMMPDRRMISQELSNF